MYSSWFICKDLTQTQIANRLLLLKKFTPLHFPIFSVSLPCINICEIYVYFLSKFQKNQADEKTNDIKNKQTKNKSEQRKTNQIGKTVSMTTT